MHRKQQGTMSWNVIHQWKKRVKYLKQAPCLIIDIVRMNPCPLIFWVVDFYQLITWETRFLKETFVVPFWASAPEIHRCTASLPLNGCVSILPVPFFTPFPLMTPSSPNRPNTKPLTLHLRCCCPSNTAPSEWSSVPRPGPRPGRRHMTWETRWSAQHTSYCKHATISHNLTIVVFSSKFKNLGFMQEDSLCQGNLLPDSWLQKVASLLYNYIHNFYKELFWGNSGTWFLMILNMSGRTNS